jgi:hypothetical protein
MLCRVHGFKVAPPITARPDSLVQRHLHSSEPSGSAAFRASMPMRATAHEGRRFSEGGQAG